MKRIFLYTSSLLTWNQIPAQQSASKKRILISKTAIVCRLPRFPTAAGKETIPRLVFGRATGLALPCHKRKGGACSHLYIFFSSLAVPEKKTFPLLYLDRLVFLFFPHHPSVLSPPSLPISFTQHPPPSLLSTISLAFLHERERKDGRRKRSAVDEGKGKRKSLQFLQRPFFPSSSSSSSSSSRSAPSLLLPSFSSRPSSSLSRATDNDDDKVLKNGVGGKKGEKDEEGGGGSKGGKEPARPR